jgi:hypothetical protein
MIGLLAMPASALAQRGERGTRMYDPATVETIQGTIAAIDTMTSRHGGRHDKPGRMRPHQGLHLQVDTGNETLPVHLGPLFYLQDQGLTLRVGDAVTIRGSRVTIQNAPAAIAAEVQSNEQTWILRDDQGRPAWRGQRRRN